MRCRRHLRRRSHADVAPSPPSPHHATPHTQRVPTGKRKSGFDTLAIHAGQEPEGLTGSVTVPIFQTSTFAQVAVGKNKGYEYARTDRKSTRLNSSHSQISYAVFCLKKKKTTILRQLHENLLQYRRRDYHKQ